MDLCGIDRITHIMTLTVSYICDKGFRFSQFLADELDDIDISHLVVAADVIDFTDCSFVNDEIYCPAVIFYIESVTDIETFTVYRKRLIVQTVCDHERDKFLGEVIRSVVVGTT